MKRSLLFLLSIFSATIIGAAEIEIYPCSGGLNLRVPVIPPVPGGAKGKMVSFEQVTFDYDLAPHLLPSSSGEITFWLRDLPRRDAKTLLVLRDDRNREIQVKTTAAFATGRKLQLVGLNGQTATSATSATSATNLTVGTWQKVKLQWREGQAELHRENENSIMISLPPGFCPVRLRCQASLVDELELRQGGGTFRLDWEHDYAGRIQTAGPGGLTAQLFGFDTFVIGTAPAKRDCPALQLINSTPVAQDVIIDYQINSEVNMVKQAWKEKITIPAGKAVMDFIKFPFPLATDIYHLSIKINGEHLAVQSKHHFMYVERRSGPTGPGLFGLHDGNLNQFGVWPDALPLRYAHKYLRWGWVQGPAFAKDWNNNPSGDPAAPAAEWNWNAALDWELMSGRELFVCLESFPYSDWYRERAYTTGMKIYPCGQGGGFPRLDRYEKFLNEVAKRYKGKVRFWEIENEPNATLAPNNPEDYAAICATVYRSIKNVDPEAAVFGICGTGGFLNWMKKTLQAGAGKNLDGVSWHTYTTPEQPDQAGLASMLAEVKKAIPPEKRLFHSETGVLTVLRQEAERPIPPEVVAAKIKDHASGFVSSHGWPGNVNDEWQASSSIIRNAVINFLSGAEGFIFFGWNPAWPAKPQQWQNEEPDFRLISAALNGERTPGLQTLTVGVLTAQMAGVDLKLPMTAVDTGTVRGGVFTQVDKGEVAVLWSTSPAATAFLTAPVKELETVSGFGQKKMIAAVSVAGDGQGTFLIPLEMLPTYVHLSQGKMRILPSPVDKVIVKPIAGDSGQIIMTLLNGFGCDWQAKIAPGTVAGLTIKPTAATTEVPRNQRKKVEFSCEKTSNTEQNEYWIPFKISLPSGNSFNYSVKMVSRPSCKAGKLSDNISNPDPETIAKTAPELRLDRAEQATFGRPPKLASLQEDYFWGGKNELSAKSWIACNDQSVFIVVKVHDAKPQLPVTWPGVLGASVELFFDFRDLENGFGSPHYGNKVYQILVRPAITSGMTPQIYSPQLPDPDKSGVKVFGQSLGPQDYWVGVSIPWQTVGSSPKSFGFDVGINGAFPNKRERKTQLMLFGTAANHRDASAFGTAVRE